MYCRKHGDSSKYRRPSHRLCVCYRTITTGNTGRCWYTTSIFHVKHDIICSILLSVDPDFEFVYYHRDHHHHYRHHYFISSSLPPQDATDVVNGGYFILVGWDGMDSACLLTREVFVGMTSRHTNKHAYIDEQYVVPERLGITYLSSC